jgi:hypothetical protein
MMPRPDGTRTGAPASRGWLIAASLAVIPLGLAVGFYSSGKGAAHSEHAWVYALLLDAVTAGLAPIAMTWTATVLVRMSPDRKLLQPAVLLVLPVMATHYARAYHPLLIFLAELSWFGVLVSFAKRRRTLSLWCIVACGASVTAIQLASARY